MDLFNVLIISDHILFAQALRRLLEQEGVHILGIVASEAEAMPLIREHQPSAVLVDVNGAEDLDAIAARLLSAHRGDCQILFVSLDNTDVTVYTRQRLPGASTTELTALVRRSLALAARSR